MKVKRYVVGAVPEALPLIRGDLGSNAVILSTKEIRTGGFLGMFGKKRIEVIAAAESDGAGAARTPAAGRSKPMPPAQPARPAETAADAVAAREEAFTAQRLAAAAVQERLAAAEPPPQAAVPQPRAAPAVQASVPAPPQVNGVLQEELLQEMRGIKTWMRQLSAQQAQDALSAPVKQLLERLEQQEVASVWREKLLQELQEAADYELLADNGEALWTKARELIANWLQPFEGAADAANLRAVHFVGPTGVGKTTTIAKLAAMETLRNKRSVGLITADTYRIAAVDQLRTYADILGVPLEVVFSPAESARAFQQLEEKELILMDTAGRNYRSELQINEVNSLLKSGEDTDTCLVLSMTARTSDMEAVALPFIRHGVNKAIFTKLDETRIYGSLLNLVLEHRLQPLYLAFGQTVPDDIEPFGSRKYSALLLGEYDHG